MLYEGVLDAVWRTLWSCMDDIVEALWMSQIFSLA